MIITYDRPWRRHDRLARRFITLAILLAATLVLAEWLWWYGPSLLARTLDRPASIQSIDRAGDLTYSRFTRPPDHALFAFEASTRVTSKNWTSTRDLDPSPFVCSETASTSDESTLRSRGAFYLNPPLSQHHQSVRIHQRTAVGAHFADGSRVWIYELCRAAQQSKPFFSMKDYAQRALYRRDIIVLDASHTFLFIRASRDENLLTGTLRFATLKFLALADLLLLVVALPAG